jgi:hypothetical protein
MTPELDEELVRTLREELSRETFKATHVERVDLERGRDADGNPALFVRVTLGEPAEGAETWPATDVQRLRQLVRDAVLRLLQDDLAWYVRFETATSAS